MEKGSERNNLDEVGQMRRTHGHGQLAQWRRHDRRREKLVRLRTSKNEEEEARGVYVLHHGEVRILDAHGHQVVL